MCGHGGRDFPGISLLRLGGRQEVLDLLVGGGLIPLILGEQLLPPVGLLHGLGLLCSQEGERVIGRHVEDWGTAATAGRGLSTSHAALNHEHKACNEATGPRLYDPPPQMMSTREGSTGECLRPRPDKSGRMEMAGKGDAGAEVGEGEVEGWRAAGCRLDE